MILDQVLMLVTGALLIASLWRRPALPPAAIVAVSLFIDWLVFIEHPSWLQLKGWAVTLAVKDALLAFIIALRREPKELPLIWAFFASCLLHQVIFVEVDNQELTMFYFRPDIMRLIATSMLASVIYILLKGGDSNGGKRFISRLFYTDNRLRGFFYFQTLKVKK